MVELRRPTVVQIRPLAFFRKACLPAAFLPLTRAQPLKCWLVSLGCNALWHPGHSIDSSFRCASCREFSLSHLVGHDLITFQRLHPCCIALTCTVLQVQFHLVGGLGKLVRDLLIVSRNQLVL